jgi:hypothetical protein
LQATNTRTSGTSNAVTCNCVQFRPSIELCGVTGSTVCIASMMRPRLPSRGVRAFASKVVVAGLVLAAIMAASAVMASSLVRHSPLSHLHQAASNDGVSLPGRSSFRQSVCSMCLPVSIATLPIAPLLHALRQRVPCLDIECYTTESPPWMCLACCLAASFTSGLAPLLSL